MRVIGITRLPDAFGRVCIPKEYLQQINVVGGKDPVEIKLIEDEKGEKQILISEVKKHGNF